VAGRSGMACLAGSSSHTADGGFGVASFFGSAGVGGCGLGSPGSGVFGSGAAEFDPAHPAAVATARARIIPEIIRMVRVLLGSRSVAYVVPEPPRGFTPNSAAGKRERGRAFGPV